MRYWGKKLEDEEPEIYAKLREVEMELLGKAAEALGNDYLRYLKRAEEHRKGTKVRLYEIMRYVYHYGNYVHPCLLASGNEQKARETLRSFWGNYEEEIGKCLDLIEDKQQFHWLMRLID